MNDEELAEKYLLANNWEKCKGFRIEKMGEEDWEFSYFEGETIEEAIGDYYRKTEWWSYIPSNGEEMREDIWEAVEYEEDNNNQSFDDFKKAFGGRR